MGTDFKLNLNLTVSLKYFSYEGESLDTLHSSFLSFSLSACPVRLFGCLKFPIVVSVCVICCCLSLSVHPVIHLSVSVFLSEAFICLALRDICVSVCVHLPEGFCLMDIQGSAAYSALLQRLGQGLLIHQTSPRSIDQERTLAHLRHTRLINTHISRDIGMFLCFYEPVLQKKNLSDL